jgi:hypothetical protein
MSIFYNESWLDISKAVKLNSEFKFNFIVSLIAYIAINCIFHFLYEISLEGHWGNTVPYTIGQFLVYDMPHHVHRTTTRASIVVIVLIIIFGTRLKQQKTPMLNRLSVSSGFIFGFLILNISLIFSFIVPIQNEVFLFISTIPTGWIRFMYFGGNLFGQLIWNCIIAFLPSFFMYIGLAGKRKELEKKAEAKEKATNAKEKEAEESKSESETVETSASEAEMKNSVKSE